MKRSLILLITILSLTLPSKSVAHGNLLEELLQLSSFEKSMVIVGIASLWLKHVTQPEADPDANVRIGQRALTSYRQNATPVANEEIQSPQPKH